MNDGLKVVDFTKPIQTTTGMAARYVGRVNDGSDAQHIIAVTVEGNALENWLWCSDIGLPDRCLHEYNIINTPVVETRYINVYRPCAGRPFASRHDSQASADRMTGSRQALLKLTFTDGKYVGVEELEDVGEAE